MLLLKTLQRLDRSLLLPLFQDLVDLLPLFKGSLLLIVYFDLIPQNRRMPGFLQVEISSHICEL
jgi:hypothetical protein